MDVYIRLRTRRTRRAKALNPQRTRAMRRSSWTSFVISILLLAGCAVGPNYKRPQVAVPKTVDSWPRLAEPATPIEKDDWWSSFQDRSSIHSSSGPPKQNLDLKLALERVQEARAARGVARSGYFPSIDGAASATPQSRKNHRASRADRNLPSPSPVEYKIFRRLRRLMGIGCLRRDSSERAGCHCRHGRCCGENRRDVLIILLGDVARVYAQLRVSSAGSRLQTRLSKRSKTPLIWTSARRKRGLATEP